MEGSIHSRTVLVLNKQWQAVSIISVAQAFSHIVSGTADVLHIESKDVMEPVGWEKWLTLPIDNPKEAVGTPSALILAPRVIILKSYAKMPMHKPKFSLKNIYLRDKGICQYSGKRLQPSQASIDHVVPLSKGGPTSWENCVLAERSLNSAKGDKSLEEAGLKLRRKPYEPTAVPVIMTLRNTENIPEWDYFLLKQVA